MMLNYWWVTRPKRKLDSVPEVLATFADLSLNQEWSGQKNTQIAYEDALEKAGLKRIGSRRDQSGSGGRTYAAWLESLGLIFKQKETGNIKLTLAGEAIMAGDSPVSVMKNQVLKYQFPSAFSISRGVNISPRFKIHPFWFLLRLLMDDRIGYLTNDEIAFICAVDAENESERCYQNVVNKIMAYRDQGETVLDPEFDQKYGPSRGKPNPDYPRRHLTDMANTMVNWMEYTQLAKRNEEKQLVVLDEKREEAAQIISKRLPFIGRPEDHEYFQRGYGLDPKHRKDTRNLEKTQVITAKMIGTRKIQQAYFNLALRRPIATITPDIIDNITERTGLDSHFVEDTLNTLYPHGTIGSFMNSYFEMAFKGRDEAVDFEKATTALFHDVFHYNAIHLGQTGSKSAPDILLISDSDGYQAIIDNKAYTKYSITGDHHNRMVYNYLAGISNYSDYDLPIGYFSYISGGFANNIDQQIQSEVSESGVHGSAITVSNFISMVENQNSGSIKYSHADLRKIFGMDRQVRLGDLSLSGSIKDVAEPPINYNGVQ